jgi:hypothetical protein
VRCLDQLYAIIHFYVQYWRIISIVLNSSPHEFMHDIYSVCECISTVYTCTNSWKEAFNTIITVLLFNRRQYKKVGIKLINYDIIRKYQRYYTKSVTPTYLMVNNLINYKSKKVTQYHDQTKTKIWWLKNFYLWYWQNVKTGVYHNKNNKCLK